MHTLINVQIYENIEEYWGNLKQHAKLPILYSYLNTSATYISVLEANIFPVEGKNSDMILYRILEYFPNVNDIKMQIHIFVLIWSTEIPTYW